VVDPRHAYIGSRATGEAQQALAWLCAAEVASKEQRRLLGSLVKGQQQCTLEPGLAQYAKPKLLIIDELGYLPRSMPCSKAEVPCYLAFPLLVGSMQRVSQGIPS
jgi:hypothetical protein